MVDGLITLEDFNGSNIPYTSFFYCVDTDILDDDAYTDVYLDFVNISHSVNGNMHTFDVEVFNSLWTGYFYCLTQYGGYIQSGNITIDNNHIIITINSSKIRLYLHLSNALNEEYSVRQITEKPLDLQTTYFITTEQVGETFPVTFQDLRSNTTRTINATYEKPYGKVNDYPYYCFLKKTDFKCEPDNTLKTGRVNTIYLNVDEKYLPNGSLLDEDNLELSVKYNDEILPVVYDEEKEDYYFIIDLTGKTNINKVKLIVVCNEIDVVNYSETEFTFNCEYIQVNNYADLLTEINISSKIIELSDDFSLQSRITVANDIKLIGAEHTIDLNEFGFDLKDNVTFKAENIKLHNGNTAFIQGLNTKLDLTKCEFKNCKSTIYNNLGSCIFCDVNIESLTETKDFITNIEDCTFINNHNCILHGGELTINNSRYLNNDLLYCDVHNAGLLYQTDGEALLTNNIFDINYTEDDLCADEESIMYGQALVQCGETAVINGADWEYLTNDGHLPLFEIQYKNRSHIFAKYYYPQIRSCVYSSPIFSKEDQSVCYAVTGKDWIYKDNVQVSLFDEGNENTNNKFNWEDI